MKKPIDIIFILGVGHCGSTLLDLILGSHSRIESVGEIFRLPEYFAEDSYRPYDTRVCTCGAHVTECEYWNKVSDEIADQGGAIAGSVVDRLNDEKDFENANHALISAILNVSGKTVLCDSSKQIKRLNLFLSSRDFRVQILHLIRDGRAYGYSMDMKRQKIKENRVDHSEINKLIWDKKTDIYEFGFAMKKWNQINIGWHERLKNHPNYFLMRYEDLVMDPVGEISRILEKLNLQFEKSQLEFEKFEHHNLAGNRMRMKKAQGISSDTKYLKNLSFLKWWKGTILTMRGLHKFGYRLSRRGMMRTKHSND